MTQDNQWHQLHSKLDGYWTSATFDSSASIPAPMCLRKGWKLVIEMCWQKLWKRNPWWTSCLCCCVAWQNVKWTTKKVDRWMECLLQENKQLNINFYPSGTVTDRSEVGWLSPLEFEEHHWCQGKHHHHPLDVCCCSHWQQHCGTTGIVTFADAVIYFLFTLLDVVADSGGGMEEDPFWFFSHCQLAHSLHVFFLLWVSTFAPWL